MESHANNSCDDGTFHMNFSESFSSMLPSYIQSNPGLGVDVNQSDQMSTSTYAQPIMPQAASAFGNEYTNSFQSFCPRVAEANVWPPATFADPFLGASNPSSPFPTLSQNGASFQQPRIPSEARITTPSRLMAPVGLSTTMLPPGSPLGPALAPANSTERGRSNRAEAEWNRHKDIIWKLYMEDNETLGSTMETMKEEHGFIAETNKFKHYLRLWGFEKNLRGKQSRYIKHVAKRRKIEGKKTEFRRRGAIVPRARVDRLLNEKQKSISSGTCSPPSNISYGTPHPKSLTFAATSPSKVQQEQLQANASTILPAKAWVDYDMEGLHDLHIRAVDEAEKGNHGQARIMFLETLDGYESLAGPCHYSTIEALSSFAKFCKSGDSFDEAKDRMLKSFFNHHVELGGQHQKTLESTARLGHFYMRHKRYGESETHLTTAKIGLETIFRSDQEESFMATMQIDEDLIDIYQERGDYGRCEKAILSRLHKLQALQTTQKHYTNMVYATKHRLSRVYRDMWFRRDEIHVFPYRPPPLIKAENLLLDVIKHSEKTSEVTHIMLCSFELLREQYDYFDEDERLSALLTQIGNKISGVVDAKGRMCHDQFGVLSGLELGMARSYARLGNREASEWWHLRLQDQVEEHSGPESWDAIRNLVHTARFYLDQHEWDEAEPLLRDAQRKAENNKELDSREEGTPERSVRERIARCLANQVWEPGCKECGV